MSKFARFAATFLSLALAAGAASAAPLRDIRSPSDVRRSFPVAAKVRVLNVWATWCVPCVAEMEDLRALDAAFDGRVVLIGVTLDDMIPGDRAESKKKVERFLARQQISFQNLYYIGNSEALARELGFDGEIPLTVIYGKDGKEVWRHQGRIDRREVERQIRKVLRRNG